LFTTGVRQIPGNSGLFLRQSTLTTGGYPPDKKIELSEAAFPGKGHQLLYTDLGALDVLGAIEDGLEYKDLLAHSVEVNLRGRTAVVRDDVVPCPVFVGSLFWRLSRCICRLTALAFGLTWTGYFAIRRKASNDSSKGAEL
jgi:hypothetical protein